MSSAKQIVILRLQRKRYPAERVEQYITYRGSRVILTDSQKDDLLKVIPEMWNSEKDQLVNFGLYDNQTFACTRHKQVYNFSTKQSEIKSYFFDSATPEQVTELVNIIIDFYNQIKLQEVDNFYDAILDKINDVVYIKEYLLDVRKDFLSQSDYMFNSDYTFKSEEDREKWISYRQEWRDITESDAWKSGDFLNISIPVSPDPRGQFCQLGGLIPSAFNPEQIPKTEYEKVMSYVKSTEFSDIVKNFAPLAIKMNILSALSFLKLPIGFEVEDLNYINNLVRSQTSIQDLADELEISTIKDLDTIASKMQLIDDALQKYSLDFTVSDIVDGILNKMKQQEEQEALNAQADALLMDLFREENSGDTAQ